MWHEARKQEKKIREVMVDFQRRAERRREHYDKMKADPTTYLRLIGSKCRLHLDPTGGERDSTMIPWQGDSDNLISRYDVRIHMDIIPDYSKLPEPPELKPREKEEETKMNYERYRSVIINEYNNVSEADALAKIEVEEMFADVRKVPKNQKKQSKNKSAIGYDYDQSGSSSSSRVNKTKGNEEDGDSDLTNESDYEIDFDVDGFSARQIDHLNVLALDYKVSQGYFSRSLRSEKSVLMERKHAKIAEKEKSAFSGKKARKERKLFKEMSLRTRLPSPPLFAPKNTINDNVKNSDSDSKSSSSRSVSPEGKMEFITEFGSEHNPNVSSSSIHVISPPSSTTTTSSTKIKKKRKSSRSCSPPSQRRKYSTTRKSRSRSTSSSSKDSSYSSRGRSSSRDRSRSRERAHSRSRSRDRNKNRNRDRSRDRSRDRKRRSGRERHRSRSKDKSVSSRRYHRSRSRSLDRVSALTKSKLEKKVVPPKKVLPTQKQEKSKLTPQERLKRKMQSQLSKTFKEDKKVERHKAEVREVERIEREEKMKEETQKLKKRNQSDYDNSSSYYRHHHSRSPSPNYY